MSGREFWIFTVVFLLTVAAGVRVFLAAWRDHDDDLFSALGSHRWPIDEGE